MKKITKRLTLSFFTLDDAPFILQILNEDGFKNNIADRNVRSLEDARNYLQTNISPRYAKYGFGMFRVALRETDQVVGMCGIIKRDHLKCADLGYAISENFYRQGIATEAIAATLELAQSEFKLKEIAAVISPHNEPSIRLVQNFGFEFLRMEILPPASEVKLFLKKLY